MISTYGKFGLSPLGSESLSSARAWFFSWLPNLAARQISCQAKFLPTTKLLEIKQFIFELELKRYVRYVKLLEEVCPRIRNFQTRAVLVAEKKLRSLGLSRIPILQNSPSWSFILQRIRLVDGELGVSPAERIHVRQEAVRVEEVEHAQVEVAADVADVVVVEWIDLQRVPRGIWKRFV